jgi:lipoprotein-anchoring transpeptidase ErfK/SrfK
MHSKAFIAVAAALVVLLGAVVGMVLYDNSRDDTVAKGITVNGIDIGGLEKAAARARLQQELANPLNKPVTITFKKHDFTLTPQEAKLAVDVDATVDEALAASHDGNILTRTVRGLTGGKVNDSLDVAVTYDRSAVRQIVRHIKKKLTLQPVDADVNIDGAGVQMVQSQTGRRIAAAKLRKSIDRQLVSTNGSRSVPVVAHKVQPKVTTDELAKKYPSIIIVNRSAFTLRLYEGLKETKDYPIAVGMAGLETPAGQYAIQDKQVDPYWHVPNSDWAGSLAGQTIPPGPSNPIKARWMGIYNGAGIHGTDAIYSLGSAASHGCIRMSIPDVQDLYDRVDVGTPVYIS